MTTPPSRGARMAAPEVRVVAVLGVGSHVFHRIEVRGVTGSHSPWIVCAGLSSRAWTPAAW